MKSTDYWASSLIEPQDKLILSQINYLTLKYYDCSVPNDFSCVNLSSLIDFLSNQRVLSGMILRGSSPAISPDMVSYDSVG